MNTKNSLQDFSYSRAVFAASAVTYAREIVANQLDSPAIPSASVSEHALGHLARLRPDETLADLEALIVERELAHFAPDSSALCHWRAAAGLIDTGARPLLSERAADAIARISISIVVDK
jgi:hypothetical protein